MPCLSFAPELISYYPDAKVVLVERDVDKWYQSWSAFLDNAMSPGLPILAKLEPYYLGRIAAVGTKGTDLLVGSGKSVAAAKARSREAYLKHYALVRSVTPKERLLEFSLADGWGPLCEFLGKPVSQAPRRCDQARRGALNPFKLVQRSETLANSSGARCSVPARERYGQKHEIVRGVGQDGGEKDLDEGSLCRCCYRDSHGGVLYDSPYEALTTCEA